MAISISELPIRQ